MARGKFSKPRSERLEELEWKVNLEEDLEFEEVEPVKVVPESEPEQSVSDAYEPESFEPEEEYEEYYEEYESERGRGRSGNKKILLISLCAVVAVLLITSVLGIWFFLGWPADDGLILNNVTVAGVHVGGMTRQEAEAAIRKATEHTYTQQSMVIQLPDTILELKPSDTGAKLDMEAVVEAAYDYGRKGSLQERENAKKQAESSVHHIVLLDYLTLDTDYIRQTINSYGGSFNSTYTPSSAVMEGQMPILDASEEGFDPDAACQTLVVTLGTPGRHVDIEDVYNQVLDAYSTNRFQVVVELEEEEKTPEAIDLVALHSQYTTEAVDAVMDSETYEVTNEIYGYSFDLDAALAQMEQAAYGDVLEIPMVMVAPGATGGEMSSILFRDVLGEFQTEHTDNKNRNNNLTLACAAINGYVLDAGETFDFNTVVGKRTAAKGYKAADAYDGGMTVKTLGGGICQVSSTIYYCCLVADLEIVERSPHSYVSSYMPMGTDATVSWGGPEFSFKNNTNYPIRIEAEVSDGFVKVKLIGTDEKDYYIEMESEIKGITYAKTVYEEIPEDNNPNGYKDGEVISSPYNGYTIQTYKLKYDKETGELIEKVEDRVSRYKKRDYTIAKIVKAETPTEPPVDTPEPDEPTTPAPSTPTPDTPEPTTPAPEPTTPAPETPAPTTPAPETPAPTTPVPETPAPETPAPETPAADSPAPETPAADTPAESNP